MNKLSFLGLALAFATGVAVAQQKEVTIAYQDMLDPYRVSQEAKDLEQATGTRPPVGIMARRTLTWAWESYRGTAATTEGAA